MKLIYTQKEGFAAPPVPWPAADHDEENPRLAEAKVASGFYTKAEGRGQKPASGAQEAASAIENEPVGSTEGGDA